jgi:class 3 adenylate cyclase
MKFIFTSIFLILAIGLGAQSIEALERQLEESDTPKEKIALLIKLGEAHKAKRQYREALDYAQDAVQLASNLNDKGTLAQLAMLKGEINYIDRSYSRADTEYKNAFAYARQAGDMGLMAESTQKRAEVANRQQKYRQASQIYEEAFKFFSNRSISKLSTDYDVLKEQLARDQRKLVKEKSDLQSEIQNLQTERNQILTEKQNLENRQVELVQKNQKVNQQLSQQNEQLANIEEEKDKALLQAQAASQELEEKATKLKEMTKQQLEQEVLLQRAEMEAQSAQMEIDRNKSFMLLAIVAAVALIILALLIYGRYRSSKKAKKTLEEKNKVIQHERERSDELLLNILPASIAEELKEYGKASAKQYKEVTVLFSDFKNFTKVAEALKPEELVKELDKCFKAFDFITSQYADVEKIKTIGDAYMCASGLTERRTMPNNIIKAALEMQEFLDEYKQERMRIGKPYFEARIGLHTGPVVAGVVGVNKFAYDIWGDTVNIAARMEANSMEGQVNISEDTYSRVKYNFECEYRGKVQAKNKGAVDMYFVKSERKAVAV